MLRFYLSLVLLISLNSLVSGAAISFIPQAHHLNFIPPTKPISSRRLSLSTSIKKAILPSETKQRTLVKKTDHQEDVTAFISKCSTMTTCLQARQNDCNRCYVSSVGTRSNCLQYTSMRVSPQQRLFSIIGPSTVLLINPVDVESPYCVGFKTLLLGQRSDILDIGSDAFINTKGAESMLTSELRRYNVFAFSSAELIYNDQVVAVRLRSQKNLAGSARLPAAARIRVHVYTSMRSVIIRAALNTLSRKPNWSDVYVTNRNEISVVEENHSRYIVTIPFRPDYAGEFRRWSMIFSVTQSFYLHHSIYIPKPVGQTITYFINWNWLKI